MKIILNEIFKFLIATLFAILAMLVFVFMLDIICWIVTGGWLDIHDELRAGSWPIVKGTVSRIFLSPFIFTISVILGFGGIARMIMGNNFLREV